MKVIDKVECIRQAQAKYEAYDPLFWTKEYFDEISGGYVVYHKDHNFTKTGGGGKAEKTVGEILAMYNGKQVEFLPEGDDKSPDIRFDNHTWDIKYIEHSNEQTIRNHIKDARKADNAIFYFTKAEKFEIFSNSVGREVGRFLKGQTSALPDIYYIDKKSLLKLFWEKQKEAK